MQADYQKVFRIHFGSEINYTMDLVLIKILNFPFFQRSLGYCNHQFLHNPALLKQSLPYRNIKMAFAVFLSYNAAICVIHHTAQNPPRSSEVTEDGSAVGTVSFSLSGYIRRHNQCV